MGLRSLALLATFALAIVAPGIAAKDGIEAVRPAFELKVIRGRSKLLRAGADIRRTAVADAGIADVIQVAPRELMIVGKAAGKTDVTIWIGDKAPEPVVLSVNVALDQPGRAAKRPPD
ncbi:MAG: pilus assembly protein N-terminal domain-containing protein [Thermoguttaceae bacterium]